MVPLSTADYSQKRLRPDANCYKLCDTDGKFRTPSLDKQHSKFLFNIQQLKVFQHLGSVGIPGGNGLTGLKTWRGVGVE